MPHDVESDQGLFAYIGLSMNSSVKLNIPPTPLNFNMDMFN